MHLNYFKELKPFKYSDDIPDLPKVSKEEWNEIIVPNLIRCGAIPKSKLKVGQHYLGHCRNSNNAVWKGDHFEYERYKWGTYYTDKINHFEDDDGFDLFVPLLECSNPEEFAAMGE